VFANPFVITLVAMTPLASTAVADPDAKPAPPTKTKNPPAPKPQPPQKNPPPPKVTPVDYDQHWTVTKIKGRGCFANPEANCPKAAPGKAVPTCNPPPPIKYACPEDLADGGSIKIVLRANTTECFLDRGNMSCPPNMKCNPPPPKQLACPIR